LPPHAPGIAAVVVLYNPGDEAFSNVASYLDQVDVLYAVDNSESPSPRTAVALAVSPKICYHLNNANLGVARALNIGAKKAADAGFDLLLTMDQDSRAAPDMVERLLECLAGRDMSKVGIISPFHLTAACGSPRRQGGCREVMTPMTSGNLLNLHVYLDAGPFRDDLFIDFVDNEYCLRLRRQGYSVLRADRALLYHSVGDTRRYGPFIATNHSPLRRYYKTRNRFFVNRRYRWDFPGHCLFDRVRLTKEIFSILLFEREKVAKLRMMWRGYLDYRRGCFGKYKEGSQP
jgi:rhamnosyltransferase